MSVKWPLRLTDEDVFQFSRRVDSLFIGASSVEEMYGKLNLLRRNSSRNRQLLRSQWWVQGVLVALVVKPSPDYPEEGGE